jgi:hypothetical protein
MTGDALFLSTADSLLSDHDYDLNVVNARITAADDTNFSEQFLWLSADLILVYRGVPVCGELLYRTCVSNCLLHPNYVNCCLVAVLQLHCTCVFLTSSFATGDDQLLFLSCYLYLRYAPGEAYLAPLRASLSRCCKSRHFRFDKMWFFKSDAVCVFYLPGELMLMSSRSLQSMRGERASLFNYIYAAAMGKDASALELDGALWTLQRWPAQLVDWYMRGVP